MRKSSLLFHRDFRQLWTGDSISQVGSAVTVLALPYLAIRSLHATPFQVALLTMFQYLAFLLLGLPAGAWVDRMRHRRVMITGDLGRAVLLGSIPLAYAFHALSLLQLYVVTFGTSVLTLFFDVAYQSLLPALVDGEQLVDGNAKLEATRNVAQVGGPGLGGVVINVLSAPAAIAIDAVSFVLSAVFLGRIRKVETRPVPRPDRNLRAEIAEGLRFVFGNRILRAIACTAAISNLCGTIGISLLMVLLADRLHLSAFLCGLVFCAAALGGIVGALVTERVVARLGEGPAIWICMIVSTVCWFGALPLYQADWRLALAITLHGLGWVTLIIFNITQVSFRQRVTPKPLLGRMNATIRFVVWGSMPIGALIGGVLGQTIGVRPAMWIGVSGELLAVLPVLFSPIRTMRELPATLEPDGSAAAVSV
ncbi:MFS family permease [Kitasatospora sp. MAA4]|uniref:MFS transporter n=1 Tax=Kitasatospora sp. MAA4 TaxID=3035093 RepID=UPI0024760991|nr:MFS transporter [Kitasatospora sp. MAA4]MDH6130749.1 MFS family permease [Kitasatospora sp. MAA4]